MDKAQHSFRQPGIDSHRTAVISTKGQQGREKTPHRFDIKDAQTPFRTAVEQALNGDPSLLAAHHRGPGDRMQDPEVERRYSEIILQVCENRREISREILMRRK